MPNSRFMGPRNKSTTQEPIVQDVLRNSRIESHRGNRGKWGSTFGATGAHAGTYRRRARHHTAAPVSGAPACPIARQFATAVITRALHPRAISPGCRCETSCASTTCDGHPTTGVAESQKPCAMPSCRHRTPTNTTYPCSWAP